MEDVQETPARRRSPLRFLIWSLTAFGLGYVAAQHGPPVHDVFARLHGLAAEVAAPAPALGPARADDPRELLTRMGTYAGALEARIDELRAGLKENKISWTLLERRGEPSDSEVFRRLGEEQAGLERSIGELQDHLQEALGLEARLQDLVDAEASVDAGEVTGRESLYDARSLLTRLETLGLGRAR